MSLVCNASGNVLDFHWRVMYPDNIISIGFKRIKRSASEEDQVTESITLSSNLSMSSLQSTLSVNSSNGEIVLVTFICSGTTQTDGDFNEIATVPLPLPTISATPTADASVPSSKPTSEFSQTLLVEF